jgi:hypothetical protein
MDPSGVTFLLARIPQLGKICGRRNCFPIAYNIAQLLISIAHLLCMQSVSLLIPFAAQQLQRWESNT